MMVPFYELQLCTPAISSKWNLRVCLSGMRAAPVLELMAPMYALQKTGICVCHGSQYWHGSINSTTNLCLADIIALGVHECCACACTQNHHKDT